MQTNYLSAERVFTRISNLQHGSASRTQLLLNGVSDDTIDRRLASGLWINIAPAIYRSAARPTDWRMLASAALLEAHCGAVFAGRTALGFLGYERAVEAHLPARLLVLHHLTHEGPLADVRQVIGWPESEIVSLPLLVPDGTDGVEAFRCTNAARSLVDIGCWSRDRDFEEFVALADDAVMRGVTTYSKVMESALLAKELRRRHINPVLRWIETRLYRAANISALEELAQRKFRRWGVAHLMKYEVPHPAFPGDKKRADGVCESTAYIFEFDSREHHLREMAFHTDRERDLRSLEAGWKTARLTWAHFTTNEAQTRMRVRKFCGLDGGVRAAS
jgi:hypothetical protein